MLDALLVADQFFQSRRYQFTECVVRTHVTDLDCRLFTKNGFIFRNDHARVTPGPFSADKWVSPSPQPGDLVLFPSYLMHAVPPNAGARRVSLAFNAIPMRLDSWGYTVGFSG